MVSYFFFLVTLEPTLRATQTPIQRVTEILSPVVKRQKPEANQSTRFSVELKSE
jgi:hypothetical protein